MFKEYSVPKAVYGELDGFSLTSSKDSANLGGNISITLTNISEEEKTTSVKYYYDIHRQTNEEWKSIFWKKENTTVGINDKGIAHSPGEGFNWDLTLTQDGLAHQKEGNLLSVCSQIQPGIYRFVFLGVANYSGSNVEAVLAVKFTVSDS